MPRERALAKACETRPPPRFERQKVKFAAPDRPDWVIDRAQQQATNNYRDYAIVTLFTDTNTGKIAIVAAGVGRGGTIAAGEFLTDSGRSGTGRQCGARLREEEYGVRAEHRDHRRPTWHAEDGSRLKKWKPFASTCGPASLRGPASWSPQPNPQLRGR